jgi:hypothetical protein
MYMYIYITNDPHLLCVTRASANLTRIPLTLAKRRSIGVPAHSISGTEGIKKEEGRGEGEGGRRRGGHMNL